MKIAIDLPEDLDWLKALFMSAYEGAEMHLATEGTDAKWASGYFAGVKEVIHMTEGRYAELADESRRRYESPPPPTEPRDIRLEELGLHG